MTASEIFQKLLEFRDVRIQSKAHFQLHSLFQDLLVVGQALDVDGSRSTDLSVLQDFPAEIFIQRPDILFTLHDILSVNANQALKSLAAQALTTLAQMTDQTMASLPKGQVCAKGPDFAHGQPK